MKKKYRLLKGAQMWHAMSRGVRKTPTFHCEDQMEEFLERMKEGLRKYPVKMLGFTLMTNHHHMELNSEVDAMGAFMRHVNGAYARSFNRQTGNQGHVFESRYQAFPVYTPERAARTSAYIHLNPYVAGISKFPSLYKWSSLGHYLGRPRNSLPIETGILMKGFGKDPERYRKYIKARWDEVEMCVKRPGNLVRGVSSEIVFHEYFMARRIFKNLLQECFSYAKQREMGEVVAKELLVELADRTRLIPPGVCAGVLGCSVKSLRKYRGLGREKWKGFSWMGVLRQRCLSSVVGDVG